MESDTSATRTGGGARRFLLAAPADPERPHFAPGEEEHARRSLRLAPGESVIGIDGTGLVVPCRIVAGAGRALALEAAGPAHRERGPGEPGAPLPHLSVAVAWPRGERGEALIERLVQLGAARVVPLRTARTGPGERVRRERLERIAREALKQCRRAHALELAEPADLRTLAAAVRPDDLVVTLDPATGGNLVDLVRRDLAAHADGTWPRRALFVVGPEGGFDPDERAVLAGAGARPVRLGPHVLRIETAAEAAVSACVAALTPPERDGAGTPPGAGP